MDIWDILWIFGIFYGYLGYLLLFGAFCVHLVHFSGFGITYQEKSDPFLNTHFETELRLLSGKIRTLPYLPTNSLHHFPF
jgi:hypothetical protein